MITFLLEEIDGENMYVCEKCSAFGGHNKLLLPREAYNHAMVHIESHKQAFDAGMLAEVKEHADANDTFSMSLRA